VKTIDEVRGFERKILFSSTGGYTTDAGLPLTNCVVEVKGRDPQARCPVLSFRFYYKPDVSACPYDDDTPIGVEVGLGPELAQSLYEQWRDKWPESVRAVKEMGD
jgi:hypothetical protein